MECRPRVGRNISVLKGPLEEEEQVMPAALHLNTMPVISQSIAPVYIRDKLRVLPFIMLELSFKVAAKPTP